MSAIPKAGDLLARYCRPSDWLAFEDGRILVKTGKVELGQGILTALAQIAAEELDREVGDIEMVSGDTEVVPDEGYTAGSLTIEHTGEALRQVCAEVRGRLRGVANGTDYEAHRAALRMDDPLGGCHRPKPADARRIVGRSVPRTDLAAKLSGAAFIHDLAFPDTLHARMVHPPRAGAMPVDLAAARGRVGLPREAVLVEGAFVAVLADREVDARRNAERLKARLEWTGQTGETPLAADDLEARASRDTSMADGPVPLDGDAVRASYRKPYIAHASIGPSCGLARFDGERLVVWTHSQGVFALRRSLAAMLALAEDAIAVRHVQGAGCYGHNGADDAAAEAAFIAVRRPGRVVRVQWSRADELSLSPAGSAMRIDLAATLDAEGRIAAWVIDLWSGTHGQRPGMGGAVNLLPAALAEGRSPVAAKDDVPAAVGFGAERNARPLYEIGAFGGTYHRVETGPVRTSSQRTLGAFANVFAIEMFMDALAAKAGLDPFAFRRRNLSDGRALAVLDRLEAEAAGLDPAATGIALARYKGVAAFVGCAIEVAVDEAVTVRRVVAVVDAGRIVNPDGLSNQIEGGILQGLSWALKESLAVAPGRILTESWEDYPILTFAEVPAVTVAQVDRPDEPSLGVGEAAQGPAAGALGNAVARALGMPVRTLPLTSDRVAAAILAEQ